MKIIDKTKTYALTILIASLMQAACSADMPAATGKSAASWTSDSSSRSVSAASPFQAVLAAEYQDLAHKKRNMLDLSDYSHFRKKSTAAARGEKVKIDPAGSREMDEGADSTRISTARSRLENLPHEVYSAFPRDAARAQVAFDCWFEEMADHNEPGNCEVRLNDVLAQMECPGGCDEEPAGDVVRTYDVSFDLNSAELQPSAKAAILQAAAEIQGRPGVSVRVSGHTDRSGDVGYNMKLAKKRAGAVAAMLQERGVPGSIITVEAMGERAQAVVTDDDINLEGNRRVVISIIRSAD